MPVNNRLAARADAIKEWRRHLHQNPEIMYEVQETAAFVAEKLRAFGCDDVVEGLGQTGVVGIIKGNKGDGPTVGLRSDMDALPIEEETGVPHASTKPGMMHACGHDGHTAMLLGAAEHLCETRGFAGSVAVIFQPAEEGGAGAKAMMDDGLFERFGIEEVYGMHNYPGIPVGQFAMRVGPTMAATDIFQIVVTGVGGHAARPHTGIDPVVTSAQIITMLQTIASRNADPLESIVVSVTTIHAGDADNVIPERVKMTGTVRTLIPEMRDLAEKRIGEIVESVSAAMGCTAVLDYERNYPVVVNHERETQFAATIASKVVGADKVDTAMAPVMGGEDFAFMLEGRPGAFIFTGNGEDSANLHSPHYDFNDDIIPLGTSYWVELVETRLAG
ncbi:MAG: amidohydrolase [Rhizobiales bacterium]|nr:amidohydrolase [Hyphomicrobiales bacterium]MBO6699767.1 amidohydrolase [Hyphomicrobiales bacterium]MBO6737305.1 amidohydrolase [Hyphomicrobiales bacterium]MBO6911621.1 amidohydrolase [Hyphomicrobiales bacterium]MBO6954957.1 amidohydrolase [Hyphomicrobiales bacterium]